MHFRHPAVRPRFWFAFHCSDLVRRSTPAQCHRLLPRAPIGRGIRVRIYSVWCWGGSQPNCVKRIKLVCETIAAVMWLVTCLLLAHCCSVQCRQCVAMFLIFAQKCSWCRVMTKTRPGNRLLSRSLSLSLSVICSVQVKDLIMFWFGHRILKQTSAHPAPPLGHFPMTKSCKQIAGVT